MNARDALDTILAPVNVAAATIMGVIQRAEALEARNVELEKALKEAQDEHKSTEHGDAEPAVGDSNNG